ncbi:hypothetical protein EDB80DRAFT_717483, partial [Ilyonectria destructans]
MQPVLYAVPLFFLQRSHLILSLSRLTAEIPRPCLVNCPGDRPSVACVGGVCVWASGTRWGLCQREGVTRACVPPLKLPARSQA